MDSQKLEDFFVVHALNNINIMAIEGTMEKSLEEFRQQYKGSVEFAPVRKEPKRDFLAGVSLKPLVDTTIARSNKSASIFTVGLDYKKTKIILEEVAEASGISPLRGDALVHSVDEMALVEKAFNTPTAEKIAKATGHEFSTIWELVRYANYLGYWGIPEMERIAKAEEKFGIHIFPKKLL